MDPAGPQQTKDPAEPKGRTGRNLPAAIGVGVVLGGLVFLTLLTVKATFLVYMGVAVGIALAELISALAKRDINIPWIPVAAGGIAMVACAYWLGSRYALVAMGLTVIAIAAWRLTGGASGYVKDTTAGVFAAAYLPLMATFVAALLLPADGPRRVLTFIILTICSDIGGYFAGITVGRHPDRSCPPRYVQQGHGRLLRDADPGEPARLVPCPGAEDGDHPAVRQELAGRHRAGDQEQRPEREPGQRRDHHQDRPARADRRATP